ncbi:stage III sporulation protein AG [Numidum massiliense]|uniref:stage III sporulation protein AG n=1 Tax=Numidum massiliense TaxID=1522315 RepID=UPI0006D5417A|nr:stage III sporulation protein AG [Numidum massiliense]
MFKSLWERMEEEWKKGAKGAKGAKKMRTFQWLLLIASAGVALILFSSFLSVRTEGIPPRDPPATGQDTAASAAEAREPEAMSIEAYEQKIAADLSELLEKVVGLEQVSVQVNLKSTEMVILEKNVNKKQQVTEEADKQGGKRKVTDTTEESQVVVIPGKHGDQPVVLQRLKPDVKGIIIVARGVENLQVKSAVLQAVRAYLDVPPHKIAILPKG